MPEAKSVVVVGGGVIGLCVAYYAARQGHRVTVLERGLEGRDACSLGNAGMVVPSHFVPLAAPGMVGLGLRMLLNPRGPFAIRPRPDADLVRWAWEFWRASNAEHVRRAGPVLRDLSLASRARFAELAEAFGDGFGLTQRGLLMLCKTEAAFREEAHLAASARALGLAAEVLDPGAAATLDPGLRMDVAGAVYFPQDCHLSPNRFIAGLTEEVKQSGVELRCGAEVTRWEIEGGRVASVDAAGAKFAADEFVIAGGAWSGEVARALGLRLPMQAGKGYSLTLERPKRLPQLCSILTEARVAVTPMGGALRFAGTMEIAGLDDSVNQRRVDGLIASIPAYFPEFSPNDFSGVPVWRGLRPCSPDGMPYIGRFARIGNLIAATGHAMMGVSLGPVTGRIVADLVSGTDPGFDLTLTSPDRYA